MLNKIKPSNTPLTLCYLYLPLTNQHQPFQFGTKKEIIYFANKKKKHIHFQTHLLIVLLECSQILSSLGKLALLHSFTNIPMHKGPLRIHQIKLMIQPGPSLRNSCRIAQHAHSSLHLGTVAAGHHRRRLVIDANLEACRTPIDKLDALLCFDGRDRRVDVLGHHIAPVEHAAGHVFAISGIALDHLVLGLEHGVGDLHDVQLFVVGLC